jgi:hypothetical protein
MEGLPDLEILEWIAEGMATRLHFRGSLDPAAGHRAEHGGRALQRGSLHVVLDAAHPAEFLAASRATRSAMDERRQRGAVTGRRFGAVAIDDQKATVIGARPEHHCPGGVCIMREEGPRQTAAPSVGKRGRVVDIPVDHQRGDGAEGLDLMQLRGSPGVGTVEESGRQERPLGLVGAVDLERLEVPGDEFRLLAHGVDLLEYVLPLPETHERSHSGRLQGGMTDPGGRQFVLQSRSDGIGMGGWNEGAADGGAFLPGLAGHLAHDFAYEQVELGGSGPRIGPQDGSVDRVALGDESHRMAGDGGMVLQELRGLGRTGERHDILAGQVVEQIARGADDHLEGARRQEARFVDQAHQLRRDIRRDGRRLGHHRHSREEGRREFLKRAPAWKVEGVDVDGHTLAGDQNMPSDETTVL